MKTKCLKTLATAFLALVSSVAVINAQDEGDVFDFTFNIPNAAIFEVFGLPNVDSADVDVSIEDSEVYVDGKGKISGFAVIEFHTPDFDGVVIAKVSGSMGNKGTDPTVTMKVSGSGIADNDDSQGKAKVSFNFTGSPLVVSNIARIDGEASGSFKPGIKGESTVSFKNMSATIAPSDVDWSSGIESDGVTGVIFKNKINLAGAFDAGDSHLPFTGTGSAKDNGTFSVSLKGTTWAKGSNLKLKCELNNPDDPEAGFDITSATGKVMGQKVDSAGSGDIDSF